MKLLPEHLIITAEPKQNSGGQHAGMTNGAVTVALIDGSMSVTCGIERSQLKNKSLAISLIELALTKTTKY